MGISKRSGFCLHRKGNCEIDEVVNDEDGIGTVAEDAGAPVAPGEMRFETSEVRRHWDWERARDRSRSEGSGVPEGVWSLEAQGSGDPGRRGLGSGVEKDLGFALRRSASASQSSKAS